MTRPKADIDWDVVDDLMICGCSGVEIAGHFGINCETLYRRVETDFNMGFSEYLHQKRSDGDAQLRKAQFEVAKNDKNTTMLIWLGKQRLGQKEPENKSAQEALSAFQQYFDKQIENETKDETHADGSISETDQEHS